MATPHWLPTQKAARERLAENAKLTGKICYGLTCQSIVNLCESIVGVALLKISTYGNPPKPKFPTDVISPGRQCEHLATNRGCERDLDRGTRVSWLVPPNHPRAKSHGTAVIQFGYKPNAKGGRASYLKATPRRRAWSASLQVTHRPSVIQRGPRRFLLGLSCSCLAGSPSWSTVALAGGAGTLTIPPA
jgi:hypothetical protein